MRWMLGLALLAAACRTGPDRPFDAGHPIHVIVGVPSPSPDGQRIEPVVTLDAEVRKPGARVIGAKGVPGAVEVATFIATLGAHRFAMSDGVSSQGVEKNLDVDGELWLLVEFEDGGVSLRVFDEPPGPAIGVWRPLVAVPD